jgi:20S proteasome alpha/beta subunit
VNAAGSAGRVLAARSSVKLEFTVSRNAARITAPPLPSSDDSMLATMAGISPDLDGWLDYLARMHAHTHARTHELSHEYESGASCPALRRPFIFKAGYVG